MEFGAFSVTIRRIFLSETISRKAQREIMGIILHIMKNAKESKNNIVIHFLQNDTLMPRIILEKDSVFA